MMWDEWDDSQTQPQKQQPDQDSCFNFDLLPFLSKPKVVALPFYLLFFIFCNIRVRNWQCMQDYYKILEVDYDATEDAIRSNYIRLALVLILDFSLSFLGLPLCDADGFFFFGL